MVNTLRTLVVEAHVVSGLADDLLRLAGRVDVSRIDEVDPRVERAVDDPDRLGVIGGPPLPERHRAETQLADRDACASEWS